MKERIKIGLIGLGGRGQGLLKYVILLHEEVEIVAVCDLYEDRRKAAADLVKEERGKEPFSTANYQEILAMEEVDAVVIMASWSSHIGLAIQAMRAGKYVACEVGGAYSVEECWELVRTYEETGIPCMLMENCCYGREELLVLNMVKQGLFGEVVHCQGGYRHDLRQEIAFGEENRHYRLKNYMNRNCENYPTHELGPIAKILNINRGNRMLSLTSVASKAAGLHEYILDKRGADDKLADVKFAQGDVVTTIIKCAHGETITLTLDTTLPRFYSRAFHIQGTKGMYMEDNRSLYLESEHAEFEWSWQEHWNNVEEYFEKYDHPIWKKYVEDGLVGGHGGMDGLVFDAFFEAVQKNTQTPIDVYDMAAWMCITPLSEMSIANGGAPVSIPDFTNGRWINREEPADTYYNLDR